VVQYKQNESTIFIVLDIHNKSYGKMNIQK
jgi:hypothetical protein